MLDETLLESLWTPDQAEFLDRVQSATPVDAAVAAVAEARRWHAIQTAAVTAAYEPYRLGKGKVGGGRFAKKGDIGIDILRDLLRGKGTARTQMHADFGKRMRDTKTDFGRGDLTPANINKWATVAFGPRPHVAADAQAWDAGRRELAGYLSAIPARSRMPHAPDAPDVPNVPGDRNDMPLVDAPGAHVPGDLSNVERFPESLVHRVEAGNGTREHPFVTDSVEAAAILLAKDHHVQLKSPEQVSTLLDKLAVDVRALKDQGEKVPDYDLCKVTVPGTNLFCTESVKTAEFPDGIPRISMPQFGGVPIPGSKADKLPRDLNDDGTPKDTVDLTQAFIDHLRAKGVKVTDRDVDASHLKASQIELNGGKIVGMMGALRDGSLPPGAIFVSRDDYVVDGHHRWAANVGAEYVDGQQMTMPTYTIDMDIVDVLAEANQFTAEMGMPGAGVGQMKTGAPADAPAVPDAPNAPDVPDAVSSRAEADAAMANAAVGGNQAPRAAGDTNDLVGRGGRPYDPSMPPQPGEFARRNAPAQPIASGGMLMPDGTRADGKIGSTSAAQEVARAAKPPVTLPDPLPPTAVTHPDGTVWDTVDNFGMKYDPANADNPWVAKARAAEQAFDGVPLTAVKLDGTGPVLNANEAEVKLSTIERVKQTGLRPGYDPKVIIDPDGNYHIVDGHHRVAIHSAMGKDMQAQVIDLRENPAAFDTLDAVTPGNVEMVTPDERAALVERHGEEYVAKAEETARALLAKIEKMDAPITGSLTEIASETGMEMVSLDTRRKTESSLTRKLADKSVAKGLTPEEYATQIADALRFTASSPAESHAEHVAAFVQKLRDRGYVINDADIENYWSGAADDYNGINATFHALGPDGEMFPVELQFHTPETLAAKDEAHVWYEKGRASTDPQVKIEAFTESMRIFESVPRPAGIENVGVPMSHDAPAAPAPPDAPNTPDAPASPFPSATPGEPLSVPPGSATFDSNDMGAPSKVEPIPNIPADGMRLDDAEEAVNERLKKVGVAPSRLDVSYSERPGFGGTEAIINAPDGETADTVEEVLKGSGLDYTRRGNTLSYDGHPSAAARTEVPGQGDLLTGKPIEARTATDLLDGDTSPDHIRQVLKRGDLTPAQREELRRLLPDTATEAVAAALAVADRAAAQRRSAQVAAALELARSASRPVH